MNVSTGLGPDRRELMTRAGMAWAGCTLRAAPSPVTTTPTAARGSVVLFLNGGNDAASTLVPIDRDRYRAYARIRRQLAIDRRALLPLTPPRGSGQRTGLHPSCRVLHRSVEQGRARIDWKATPSERRELCHHRATAARHAALGSPPRHTVALSNLAGTLVGAGRAASETGTRIWLDLDGFDLHDNLLERHAHLWNGVDIALGAWRREFDRDTGAPTLLVTSEFGRALRPRGTGADHGGPSLTVELRPIS